jgi:predicted nucleotidyltransferase
MSDTITTVEAALFTRGDYLRLSDVDAVVRITDVTPTVLTVRHRAAWGWMEWVNARIEDWLIFPFRDFAKWIGARFA